VAQHVFSHDPCLSTTRKPFYYANAVSDSRKRAFLLFETWIDQSIEQIQALDLPVGQRPDPVFAMPLAAGCFDAARNRRLAQATRT
jgi:hypothetical protein